MRLGYFMMPLHPPGSELSETLAADLEQIVALDELGFDEAWIGEHLTAEWENIPAPDLFIAQALARTRRIVLATGVTCLPNHTPVQLAVRIAQLDHLARGRFYWGIGSGGFPGDQELADVDVPGGEARRLTRELLEEVLDLWNDPAPGPRQHPRWRYRVPEPRPQLGLRVWVKPYQRPHPPIGVAGVSPKSDMLALAGERGWMPLSINTVPMPVLRLHWQTYAASARAAGREPSRAAWRVCRDVYIGETAEQARRDVIAGVVGRDWTAYFLPLLKASRTLANVKLDPAMADEEVTLEYLAEHVWIVGDVNEVTAKLRQLYEDLGGFGTLVVIAHEWTPRERWLRSLRLLATEVLPRLPTP